jgi:hypothetical protein
MLKNKQGGLIKLIILIVIAIAVLSYFGIDIKNFFTSEQAQKNFGYIWNFLKDIWSTYLTVPAHKLWGIWLAYAWEPLLRVISK